MAKQKKKKRKPAPSRNDARQQRFVQEYLVDLNGKQAAIRAGYSAKTAEQSASRLLRSVKVKTAVEEAKAARAERLKMKADEVLTLIAMIARAHMGDFATWGAGGVVLKDSTGLTEHQLHAVAEVSQKKGKIEETSIKLHSKVQALKLYGDHLGLFDKAKHSTPNGSGAGNANSNVIPGEGIEQETWPVGVIGAEGKTPEEIAAMMAAVFDKQT
jgi:phage terminase small subunit